MKEKGVVLDTNVFVAAGFNRESHSARILAKVRAGELRLVWSEQTRAETRAVLRQIPMLDWQDVADLFRPGGAHEGVLDAERFGMIEDRDDRKFAALAAAAEVPLVTADDHLLGVREDVGVHILTPTEYLADR